MQDSAAGSMAWAGSGGTGSDSRRGYGGFPAGATNWPDPSCDTITMSRPGLACDTWKPCGIPHSGTPVSRVWLAMHGPRRTPPLRRPRPGEPHRLPGGRPRRRETRRHPVIDDAEPAPGVRAPTLLIVGVFRSQSACPLSTATANPLFAAWFSGSAAGSCGRGAFTDSSRVTGRRSAAISCG
jgi:hypothetical protein